MSVVLISLIVVAICIICAATATILCAMVKYEMRFGPEVFSEFQIHSAMQTLWTLAICAAAIINALFLLWVTYVPK